MGGLRRPVVLSAGVGGRCLAVVAVGVIGLLLADVVVFSMFGAGVGGLRLDVVVGVVGVTRLLLVVRGVARASVVGVRRRRRVVVTSCLAGLGVSRRDGDVVDSARVGVLRRILVV